MERELDTIHNKVTQQSSAVCVPLAASSQYVRNQRVRGGGFEQSLGKNVCGLTGDGEVGAKALPFREWLRSPACRVRDDRDPI